MLTQTEKTALSNLACAKNGGCSWRSAIMGKDTSESGARGTLTRLVELGYATGGTSRWHITEEGNQIAKTLSQPTIEVQPMF